MITVFLSYEQCPSLVQNEILKSSNSTSKATVIFIYFQLGHGVTIKTKTHW